MKKLFLLRHSKSSWDDPSLDDFDRPLNKRGYREADEIANYICKKAYYPDIILCSSAKRTRQTLEPVVKALDYKNEILFLDSIYEADWRVLEEEVDKIEEENIMLIGHAPGIEDYLSNLLGEARVMKTSHLAVVDRENKKLLDFIRPKEL